MVSHSIFEVQAELCRTMSNALRLEIVHVLRDGPQQVMSISQRTGYSQAIISHHLSVLRRGGVVTGRREGTGVIYQIANPKIVNICDLMREVLFEESQHRSNLLQEFPEESEG